MYDSSDDEYARRVANGGRGIPACVPRNLPGAPSQPATRSFYPHPISTGGRPEGYRRRESQNAAAGPSRQVDEDEEYALYLARGRAPFPLSESYFRPEPSAVSPDHAPSPRKRARTEDNVASSSKKARHFDESVISFSFLYLAFR